MDDERKLYSRVNEQVSLIKVAQGTLEDRLVTVESNLPGEGISKELDGALQSYGEALANAEKQVQIARFIRAMVETHIAPAVILQTLDALDEVNRRLDERQEER